MNTVTVPLEGYRRERGLVWPNYDERCAAVTFDECKERMQLIREFPGSKRICVQAGGNCGQLVRSLAEEYSAVYTFEPDASNFLALTMNTAHYQNVFRYQAALGRSSGHGLRDMAEGDARYIGKNCGARFMFDSFLSGRIPTLSVDMFELPACDLLCLDVEGGEYAALQGAKRTIHEHSPVVIIEQKGLGKRFYGEEPDVAVNFLKAYGYEVTGKSGCDVILRKL